MRYRFSVQDCRVTFSGELILHTHIHLWISHSRRFLTHMMACFTKEKKNPLGNMLHCITPASLLVQGIVSNIWCTTRAVVFLVRGFSVARHGVYLDTLCSISQLDVSQDSAARGLPLSTYTPRWGGGGGGVHIACKIAHVFNERPLAYINAWLYRVCTGTSFPLVTNY